MAAVLRPVLGTSSRKSSSISASTSKVTVKRFIPCILSAGGFFPSLSPYLYNVHGPLQVSPEPIFLFRPNPSFLSLIRQPPPVIRRLPLVASRLFGLQNLPLAAFADGKSPRWGKDIGNGGRPMAVPTVCTELMPARRDKHRVKRNMVYRSEGTWYTGFTILRLCDSVTFHPQKSILQS